MEKGVIFVAGTYGVGKSTLCEKIGKHLSIPFYSAGDLISEINGETYGSNKVVSDKKGNQDILIEAVNHKLKSEPSIILAGHFCIFDCQNNVEYLPEYVFEKLNIKYILLLEASVERICENLHDRDTKKYRSEDILALQNSEHLQAFKIASRLNLPIYLHRMKFESSDVREVLSIFKKGA